MNLEQPLTARHDDLTPQGSHGLPFLAVTLCLGQDSPHAKGAFSTAQPQQLRDS